MTPAEVSALCFGSDPNIAADFINESTILTAQRRFVLPVTGKDLWTELEKDRYSALLNDYIKPSLALYVKYLVLPAISCQPGILGVVQYSGQNFGSADAEAFARLRKEVRNEADSMMKICSDHMGVSATLYPEYDPHENILNSVNTKGGVVL